MYPVIIATSPVLAKEYLFLKSSFDNGVVCWSVHLALDTLFDLTVVNENPSSNNLLHCVNSSISIFKQKETLKIK